MYVIDSYLVVLAMILAVAAVAFAAAVVVMVAEEIARLVGRGAQTAFRAAGDVFFALMPKAPAGLWPHHHPQHSH